MKPFFNTAFIVTLGLMTPSHANSKTTEEMRLELLGGHTQACVMLGSMGVDMVDERQNHYDFQMVFDSLNLKYSNNPESTVTRTVLFLSKIIAGHPVLEHSENIERWKSEVFLLGFQFCKEDTGF